MSANSRPAPLYITIGPQCSGKTTLLGIMAQKLKRPIEDITLDGQRDVYVQVPAHYYLVEQADQSDPFLRQKVQNKTLASRVYDDETNGELRAVLQRLNGTIGDADFEDRIQSLYKRHAESRRNCSNKTLAQYREMASVLLSTVHSMLVESQSGVALPETIDLFCVESLFRPHPTSNKTGVEAGHDALWQTAKKKPTLSLAWGNTNTRPREYKEALAAAAATRRPVYFILYGDANMTTDRAVILPKVGIHELYKRNLNRMLQTGKFVPCRAMVESMHRVENLVGSALFNLQRRFHSTSFTKLQLDQELASMINFEMKEDRTVRRIPSNNENSPRRNRKKPAQSNNRHYNRNKASR